jgi:hypothetical protein
MRFLFIVAILLTLTKWSAAEVFTVTPAPCDCKAGCDCKLPCQCREPITPVRSIVRLIAPRIDTGIVCRNGQCRPVVKQSLTTPAAAPAPPIPLVKHSSGAAVYQSRRRLFGRVRCR